MELQDMAMVTLGYAFRAAIVPDSNGELHVLQAKDLTRGEIHVGTEGLTRIPANLPGYVGHLKNDDVLLVARGLKAGAFRSAVFKSEALNVIASASVVIIRVYSSDVIPEYVSLYLNSKEGQDALAGIVTGSYIGALPRKELEKIKIPIPSLEKQRTLLSLYQNIQEQQRILNRQSEINQNIINATFKNLTTK